MDGMSMLIKCGRCGTTAQIETDSYREWVNFERCLLEQNFITDTPEIEKTIYKDLIESEDDIEANIEVNLKNITIRCKECGNYIRLDY